VRLTGLSDNSCAAIGPHLVLLDISLLEIDGYKVLRRLRDQRHASQPLMAAVTGFGSQKIFVTLRKQP
jgi:DNA-binding response OmpR family regulator